MPIEDRAADTWEPLIAIADLAAGGWDEAARYAAIVLSEARESSSTPTLHTRLLHDCQTAFADAEVLPTTTLLDRLRADPEAPWLTYGNTGLTPMRLGNRLREFDISSRNLRLPTGQAKGYQRTDFTNAWARYCPHLAGGEPAQPSQAVPSDVSLGQTVFGGATACDFEPSQSRPAARLEFQAVPQPSHHEMPSDQALRPLGRLGRLPVLVASYATESWVMTTAATHPTCDPDAEEASR